MSQNPAPSPSRALDLSLAIGGCLCLAVGSVAFSKVQQPILNRGFYLLVPVFMLLMGVGKLLEARQPELGSKWVFIARVFAGFALFSLSWALSHQ
jgi:hypothetical protein